MGSCKSRQDRNNEITAWGSLNHLATGSGSAGRGFHKITERLLRPLNPNVGAHSGRGPVSFISGKR
jgi:hypothetical protein